MCLNNSELIFFQSTQLISWLSEVSVITDTDFCTTFGQNSLFGPLLLQFTCLSDGLGEGNVLMAQTLPPRLVLPLTSIALKFHLHRFRYG